MRISVEYSGRLKEMKRALWLCSLLVLCSCAHQGSWEPRLRKADPSNAYSSRACQPLSEEARDRLLEIADPGNFPRTRYRRGPATHRGIEKETDCSHFVHEVYRRAGLPYAFRPTSALGNAGEFDILPEREALPGDLMLFRGHVGMVDRNGRIISATSTRRRRKKSSITSMDRSNFRSFRGQRYVLRYRCQPGTFQKQAKAPPATPALKKRRIASVNSRKRAP